MTTPDIPSFQPAPAIEQAIDALKLARARILQVVSPSDLPTTLEHAIAGLRTLAAQPAPSGVPQAVQIVIDAMRADPDYAWSWHCNVAMSFVDAGGDAYAANQGAARFMRLLANVEPAHELMPAPAIPAPEGAPALSDEAILDTAEIMRPVLATAQEWKLALEFGHAIARAALAAQPQPAPVAAGDISGDFVEHSHPDFGGGYFCTPDVFAKLAVQAPAEGDEPQDVMSEAGALRAYLVDCDNFAIVPDVAGAFHFAWAQATIASKVQPKGTQAVMSASLHPIGRRRVLDAIRGAYDLGYNDARNARTVPGDSAPGYKGRDVETDHGGALIHALEALQAPAVKAERVAGGLTPHPIADIICAWANGFRVEFRYRHHNPGIPEEIYLSDERWHLCGKAYSAWSGINEHRIHADDLAAWEAFKPPVQPLGQS